MMKTVYAATCFLKVSVAWFLILMSVRFLKMLLIAISTLLFVVGSLLQALWRTLVATTALAVFATWLT